MSPKKCAVSIMYSLYSSISFVLVRHLQNLQHAFPVYPVDVPDSLDATTGWKSRPIFASVGELSLTVILAYLLGRLHRAVQSQKI